MTDEVFREWTIILRMIIAEDLSLLKLQNLCIEHRTDYNRCYKHLLLIHKMSYKGARKFVNSLLENYIKKTSIKKNKVLPPVAALRIAPRLEAQPSQKITIHLTPPPSLQVLVDLYEFEAGDILSNLKYRKH